MFIYMANMVAEKLEEQKFQLEDTLEKSKEIAQKLEDIENYCKKKDKLTTNLILQGIFVTVLIGVIVQLILTFQLVGVNTVPANEMEAFLDKALNIISIALVSLASGMNVMNFREIQKTKKELREMKQPVETKEELEEEQRKLKRKLKVQKENIAKSKEALKYIEFMDENMPLILADNEKNLKELTDIVEKGNLILESMKQERPDYKNIELKPDGTEQDIHKNCGEKLVKVYK